MGALVNDHGVFQHDLHVGDAGLYHSLVVFGLVVLAVFREVAEGKGDFYFLGHLPAADGFQIVQLFFQGGKALFGDEKLFFSHSKHDPFCSGRK